MREKMVADLAHFFAEEGYMDRSAYINCASAPIAHADIKREFKRYDAAVEEARAYLAGNTAVPKKEAAKEYSSKEFAPKEEAPKKESILAKVAHKFVKPKGD